MLALAWIVAVAGAVVAYVISLAGAMKTVPSLPWRDALVGVPLPLVAGALAAWCLFRPPRPPDAEPPWIAASGALLVAAFTLLLLYVSYFEQPGGPR
jgi:hypothetical protein